MWKVSWFYEKCTILPILGATRLYYIAAANAGVSDRLFK